MKKFAIVVKMLFYKVKNLQKIIIFSIFVFLDLLSKYLVFNYIDLYKFIKITSFLDITHIHNYGISFGLFANTIPAVFLIIIALLVLISISYKSDEKKIQGNNIVKTINENSDIVNFKKFLLNQIKSPYINADYEISSGDTIQKILKKYKVKDREIQLVINEYKKFGKSSQLSIGKKIAIIIEKNVEGGNSVIKFSIPITKSTTI